MARAVCRSKFQVWRDVVFALVVRHVGSKFNDKFGIAWAVIEPLIFILLLTYVRSLLSGKNTHGLPVFVFMMYGMLLLKAFRDTMQDVATCIKKDKALYAFRQVQPINSVFAVLVFNVIVDVFVFTLIITFMLIMRMEIRIDDFLVIIFLYFQVVILGASVGLLFGIAGAYVPEVNKVRALCMRPLIFISCIFFSLKDIPEEYWVYLTWNPLLHAVELCRQSAYVNYGAVGVSLSYITLCTIVLLFLALACYRITWKEVLSL